MPVSAGRRKLPVGPPAARQTCLLRPGALGEQRAESCSSQAPTARETGIVTPLPRPL